jgi:hypothetical protein
MTQSGMQRDKLSRINAQAHRTTHHAADTSIHCRLPDPTVSRLP